MYYLRGIITEVQTLCQLVYSLQSSPARKGKEETIMSKMYSHPWDINILLPNINWVTATLKGFDNWWQ